MKNWTGTRARGAAMGGAMSGNKGGPGVGNPRTARKVAVWPLASGVACLLTGATAVAQTPSFTLIQPAPGSAYSHVTGLSADGRVACGYSDGGLPGSHSPAFRWTAAQGRSDVGLLPGFPLETRVSGISGDGTTLIGTTRLQSGLYQPFKIANNTYRPLPLAAGYNQAEVNRSNSDGTIISGGVDNAGGFSVPAYWNSTGAHAVPLPNAGDAGGGFTGVSRDGSTFIGGAGGSTVNTNEAYKWTAGGGWTRLPAPAGTGTPYNAVPYGINFDGSIAVGSFTQHGGFDIATAWVNGVPINLGAPAIGWDCSAIATNDAGTVIVGGAASRATELSLATIWTPATGNIFFSDYLMNRGVSLPSGWRLDGVLAVSSDGSTFAGDAQGPNGIWMGFVATIPSPSAWLSVPLMLMFIRSHRRRS